MSSVGTSARLNSCRYICRFRYSESEGDIMEVLEEYILRELQTMCTALLISNCGYVDTMLSRTME